MWGLDGAQPLRHCQALQAPAWLDKRYVGRDQRLDGIGKRLDWHANRICLGISDSYDACAAQTRMQCDYHYQKLLRKALVSWGIAVKIIVPGYIDAPRLQEPKGGKLLMPA